LGQDIILKTFNGILQHCQHEPFFTPVDAVLKKLLDNYRVRRTKCRATGEAKAPPPILILEGVELGEGEGITVRVLGPSAAGSSVPAPVLRSASMVGQAQKVPKPPLRKTTLAIALNDRAVELLAGRSEISLTLSVTNSPGRARLKVARVFFQELDR
jgi:hypothetical protein